MSGELRAVLGAGCWVTPGNVRGRSGAQCASHYCAQSCTERSQQSMHTERSGSMSTGPLHPGWAQPVVGGRW